MKSIQYNPPPQTDFPGQRNPWSRDIHPTNYEYIQSIIDYVDTNLVRPKKYSEAVKLEVYRLRDMGRTLRQIADEVGVSKSTACLYCQKKPTMLAEVTQPGTTKVVSTEYNIQEIELGTIEPKNRQ